MEFIYLFIYHIAHTTLSHKLHFYQIPQIRLLAISQSQWIYLFIYLTKQIFSFGGRGADGRAEGMTWSQ